MLEDEKKEMTLVSKDTLWVIFAIGVFIVALFLRFVWGESGFMTDLFSYQRWLTVIAAVLFGFALGWFLYPRRPRLPFDEK